MTFSPEQRHKLNAKLRYRHVKMRVSQDGPLSYIEGWHAIAEANRIFGFDTWDRDTSQPTCIWKEVQRGQVACLFSTKVRITVRAGGSVIVRDGIGTGAGRAPTAEQAYEIAIKAAETDATKRALATFGNPFGLALYDKERQYVTKSRRISKSEPPAYDDINQDQPEPLRPVFTLVIEGAGSRSFSDAIPFIEATLQTIKTITSVDALYAFWQANLESFAALKSWPEGSPADLVDQVVSALKARAREFAPIPAVGSDVGGSESASQALAIPKERRIRNKPHLEFVARQPCLICGRRPAQAHHLKFAQPRAMALKVSDEFTVPLCSGHHDSLHKTGDERAWWARHGVLNPLKIAERLWTASRLNQEPGQEQDAADRALLAES